MKSKKHFIAIPSATVSEDCTDRGKRNVANLFSIKAEELQLRRGILLVLCKELAVIYRNVLQHSIGLRNDLLP